MLLSVLIQRSHYSALEEGAESACPAGFRWYQHCWPLNHLGTRIERNSSLITCILESSGKFSNILLNSGCQTALRQIKAEGPGGTGNQSY